MNKKLLFLSMVLFFFFLTANSWAETEYVDVVYLKNGSIIKGVIVELIPEQTVKIEMADGSIFVFKMDEIEKLTKEKREEKKAVSESD